MDVNVSGDAGVPAHDVVYENTADEVWARKALDLHQRRELQVKAFDHDGVVSAQVWGPCPRCAHDIVVQPILTAPLLDEGKGWLAALTGRTTDRGAVPSTVEVGCGCEYVHPQAPGEPTGAGKVRGCGVSFSLPTTQPAGA